MALQQVADIGFSARWFAWQQRSAAHIRAATDRIKSVWMLMAMALAAASRHSVFLR